MRLTGGVRPPLRSSLRDLRSAYHILGQSEARDFMGSCPADGRELGRIMASSDFWARCLVGACFLLAGCNTVPYPGEGSVPQAYVPPAPPQAYIPSAPPPATDETTYMNNLRACLDSAPWGDCRRDLLTSADQARVDRAIRRIPLAAPPPNCNGQNCSANNWNQPE
jgi:hypothetical protein